MAETINERRKKVIERDRRFAKHAKEESDYEIFNDKKRKELIMNYVEIIQSLGFKPIKIFGAPDPNKRYSFRAMLEFIKPNVIGIKRKHTAFFEARNWSGFSLKVFNEEVMETTDVSMLNNFKKALRIRIWNIGYTDEEIICVVLGTNHELEIKDVVDENGKLIIPKESINDLFWTLNTTGGNEMFNHLIKKKGGVNKPIESQNKK